MYLEEVLYSDILC